MTVKRILTTVGPLIALPQIALAHPGHGAHTADQGVGHVLSGADNLWATTIIVASAIALATTIIWAIKRFQNARPEQSQQELRHETASDLA